MAYDPTTGQNTPDDTGVATRITGLLDKNNDYMKSAETAGNQAANARGLLNSSIGVQAAQQARVNAALPIAQQEASQAATSNNLGLQLQDSDVQQGKQIASTEGMQTKQIASAEGMQQTDIAATQAEQAQAQQAQRDLLTQQLGGEAQLQAAEDASKKEQLGMQLTSQEKQQADALAAAKENLQTQITAQQQSQQTDIANQQWLAQFDATTRTKLQDLDDQTRMAMQQLDSQTQKDIANLNVSEDQRDSAAKLAVSLQLGYSQFMSTIMNNTDIPADARQTYMDYVNKTMQSNLNLVQQLYGVSLDSGDGTDQQIPTTPAPGTNG